jgi:hypothetical protein
MYHSRQARNNQSSSNLVFVPLIYNLDIYNLDLAPTPPGHLPGGVYLIMGTGHDIYIGWFHP